MMRLPAFLRDEGKGDSVVPPSGHTAWLTSLTKKFWGTSQVTSSLLCTQLVTLLTIR